jgi:tRNA-dihydrouridine synthase
MSKLSLQRILTQIYLPGGKIIPSRILPGPMEGIMVEEYCKAMNEFDLVPMWITPFIRITNNTPNPRKLAERLPLFGTKPVIAQIMGTENIHLSNSAKILSNIDNVIGTELNCACSSPIVVRSGAGSATLMKPEWIRDTLLMMRNACPTGGIGVKIRSGFLSADELPNIIKIIRDAQPDWITLHYRTGKEMYQSIHDSRQRFITARELLPNTMLFASGDIFTTQQAIELINETNVDGITPARGMMRNPWLIRDIETICRNENPPQRNPASFLIRLVELMSGKSKWRPGLILEITRTTWGRDSEIFKLMSANPKPEVIIELLGNIPQV